MERQKSILPPRLLVNPLVITLTLALVWTAAVRLVWPHTSYAGAGSAEWLSSLQDALPRHDIRMHGGCRDDLLAFADARVRATIAAGYFTSGLFDAAAKKRGGRYLADKCPIGPFLAASASAVSAGAAIRGGGNAGARNNDNP